MVMDELRQVFYRKSLPNQADVFARMAGPWGRGAPIFTYDWSCQSLRTASVRRQLEHRNRRM